MSKKGQLAGSLRTDAASSLLGDDVASGVKPFSRPQFSSILNIIRPHEAHRERGFTVGVVRKRG